jgi:hypothetical protein
MPEGMERHMDNDNEITNPKKESRDLVEQSKLIFLKEIIDEFRRKQALYDLGTEFAKTKKNRSPIVFIVVIGISLLFIIGAVTVTFYIQETSKRISIGIQDFEDINLKDVLDAAKRNEQEMEKALRDMETLNREIEGAIQLIRDTSRRDLDMIATETLGEAERNRRTREVSLRETRQVEQVRASFAPRIAEKQKEIDAIQKKVDEYDTRQIESARAQEEILNNQQRLFSIEMEKTTKYYDDRIAALEDKYSKEISVLKNHHQQVQTALKGNHAREVAELILKYNPKISDPAIAALLSGAVDPEALVKKLPGAYRDLLEREMILKMEDYRRLEQGLGELTSIMNELKKIPFENSVPSLLKQVEYRQKSIFLNYDALWNRLSDALGKKNEIIADQRRENDGFLYAVDHLLSTSRENGYVLDPRNTRSVTVYMNKNRQISDGSFGIIFRRDDEYIGRVRFFRRAGVLLASLVELDKTDNPIQPFDKILIQEQ